MINQKVKRELNQKNKQLQVFGCKDRQDKIGVLIANLGSPDAPTSKALRPYLKTFLGDRRVIEKNKYLWWAILNGIILNTRPKRSAKLYKRIWTEQGSPLIHTTELQTNLVAKKLERLDAGLEVAYGMRYGSPSIESALDSLMERGCSKILLFNMYPQYSATTSASNYDAVFKHLLNRRWVPTLRVAEPYYLHEEYVESLAYVINEQLEKLERKPEKLVLSYHGIPEEYIKKGDPYCCMCTETTRALIGKIHLPSEDIIHTFQSRFGRDPWLEPYTDKTIIELAKNGIKDIAVVAPGFTADCLETLDELGNEGREEFSEHGGETFTLIPCLNDHPVWIEGMAQMIEREISSWIEHSNQMKIKSCGVVCPHAEHIAKYGQS